MTTNPTHIYRHLLREVSYLPNLQSRVFFRDHIRRSFRVYLPKVQTKHEVKRRTVFIDADPTKAKAETPLQRLFPTVDQTLTKPPSKRDPSTIPVHFTPSSRKIPPLSRCAPTKTAIEREISLLARGRKFLSFLQRANNGHFDALTKMLQMTYGRTGKLKHELAAKFVVHENVKDKMDATLESQRVELKQAADEAGVSSSTTTTITPPSNPASTRFEPPYTPPPVLTALIASTISQTNTIPPQQNYVKKSLRSKPKPLPIETIWNKPMPKCRITNANRKWFVKMMENVLPPLETEQEWLKLWDLATGKTEFVGVRSKSHGSGSEGQRRPVARRRVFSKPALEVLAVDGAGDVGGEDHVRDNEDVDPLAELAVHGPKKVSTYKDVVIKGRPHQITQRYLRRHVARVLQHTPRLRTAPNSRHGVVVEWSNAQLTRPQHLVQKPTEAQTRSLFG